MVELWTKGADELTPSGVDELVLFDRAIDQALLGSIESFTKEKDRQERSFVSMLLGSPDPTYLVDVNGRIVFANIALPHCWACLRIDSQVLQWLTCGPNTITTCVANSKPS